MVKGEVRKTRLVNYGSPQTLFKLVPKDKETRYGRQFLLNYKGKTYTDSTATKFKDSNGIRWTYDIKDDSLERIALAAKLREFGEFQDISFHHKQPWQNFERNLAVRPANDSHWDENGEWVRATLTDVLEVRLSLEVPEWSSQFSFLEFCQIVRDFSETISISVYTGDDDWDSISITTQLALKQLPLGTMISKAEELLDSVVSTAREQTETGEKSPSLSQVFNFPDGIQTACKQYLLYFAEFLRDLGIKADSRIEEHAGQVLFSVTPNDGVAALQRIKEALAVYLNLPEENVHFDDSFASMRLQQQVDNLKHSQTIAGRELKLAQLVIESQDRIIDEKNQTIVQQQRNIELIKPSVMMDSATNKRELEEIYEGVRVGESEALKKWLGICLNPVTALKAVGKSILGRDEISPSITKVDDQIE